METRIPLEREVRDRNGRWYSLRLRPYVMENRYRGRHCGSGRRRSDQKRRAISGEHHPQPCASRCSCSTPACVVRTANAAFLDAYFRWPAGETEGRLLYQLGNGEWDVPQLRDQLLRVLPDDEPVTSSGSTATSPAVDARRCTSAPHACCNPRSKRRSSWCPYGTSPKWNRFSRQRGTIQNDGRQHFAIHLDGGFGGLDLLVQPTLVRLHGYRTERRSRRRLATLHHPITSSASRKVSVARGRRANPGKTTIPILGKHGGYDGSCLA
jgi:hypothetical protein